VANSTGRSEKVSWVLFSIATRRAPPESLHIVSVLCAKCCTHHYSMATAADD
jgi:hypothetical protein